MNNGPKQGHKFYHDLELELKNKKLDFDVVVAPPFITLPFLIPHSSEENLFRLSLCAQNFHFENKGAYTGEISISMLEELGVVDYALIGHSERRIIFNEDDELLSKKFKKILNSKIIPIIIIGENKTEYENGKTEKKLSEQLNSFLKGINKKELKNFIIAYEPIWAVGTNNNLTFKKAQNIVKFIRVFIEKNYGKEVSQNVRIIYGGSINNTNILDFLNEKDIDGVLVGNSSIDSKSFIELIRKIEQMKEGKGKNE